MKKMTYILIGAGQRGRRYSGEALRFDDMEMVAVADPNEIARNFIRERHGLQEEMCFASYQDVLSREKFADVAMICTLDRMHMVPALMAIEKGYDLILEKPVAPTAQECIALQKAAEAKGVRVTVCHVLRYTPFLKQVKTLLDAGKVGKIMNLIHSEGVGNLHFSSSYVRGDFRNEAESSNMLLAKSCHDLDLIQWLMGSRCVKVQSFGHLSHFTPENAPQGATDRCADGCPHLKTCPYNAYEVYRDRQGLPQTWRRKASGQVNPTYEDLTWAVENTPYGRCVYKCDNDVMDHQTVNLEYENGETAVFTVSAFNKGGRRLHIMGTKGELISTDFKTISLFTYSDEDVNSETYGKPKTEIIDTSPEGMDQTIAGGHGGGDKGLVTDIHELYIHGVESHSLSSIRTSVENHLTVFAAEVSRKQGGILVNVDEFLKSLDTE